MAVGKGHRVNSNPQGTFEEINIRLNIHLWLKEKNLLKTKRTTSMCPFHDDDLFIPIVKSRCINSVFGRINSKVLSHTKNKSQKMARPTQQENCVTHANHSNKSKFVSTCWGRRLVLRQEESISPNPSHFRISTRSYFHLAVIETIELVSDERQYSSPTKNWSSGRWISPQNIAHRSKYLQNHRISQIV